MIYLLKPLQIILILVSALTLFQCSKEKREPSEAEKLLMNKLDADDVKLSHVSLETTTDGHTTHENYLELEILNAKVLNVEKERVAREKCDDIKDFILDSIQVDTSLKFDNLKFKIIEQGFISKHELTFSKKLF